MILIKDSTWTRPVGCRPFHRKYTGSASEDIQIDKDAFKTDAAEENHFVILIMRNTSLQTLPEDWDKSLQDLEAGFRWNLKGWGVG